MRLGAAYSKNPPINFIHENIFLFFINYLCFDFQFSQTPNMSGLPIETLTSNLKVVYDYCLQSASLVPIASGHRSAENKSMGFTITDVQTIPVALNQLTDQLNNILLLQKKN